ncbi:MAG: helix-turn-helix domain-containing protein [Planctomycetes bacterium]|nr:helix-turn-helix domain-containing protein [Planctomycetota bacterium]
MIDAVNRWVSVEEIYKYLGVSKDTAYKWIDKNGMLEHCMDRP